jgi:hypothetical protein
MLPPVISGSGSHQDFRVSRFLGTKNKTDNNASLRMVWRLSADLKDPGQWIIAMREKPLICSTRLVCASRNVNKLHEIGVVRDLHGYKGQTRHSR